jgi:hypothetical protein
MGRRRLPIGIWGEFLGMFVDCVIHLGFKPKAHSENPLKRVEMNAP